MTRLLLVFAAMYLCYQSAEGVGGRVLHSPAAQGALAAATVVLGLLLAWLAWRAPLRSFAMQRRAGALRWLLGGLVATAVLKLLTIVIGLRLGAYTLGAATAAEPLGPVQLATGIALAALGTFIPALAEDMLTRGLPGARWPWRSPAAFLACTTIIYVLIHTWRLNNGVAVLLMLATFGAAYGMAMLCAGSLWAAVGLHWGWNLSGALLPFAVDVTVANRGMALWLAVAAHGLLLLALLAWWVRRRAEAHPARFFAGP